MKPFEHNPKCEKCGGENLEVEWKFPNSDYGQYLHVICASCKYWWEMKTKDAQIQTATEGSTK